ncbi:MAG: Asp-tRNA(Asn)/Glu-tRNA(Gln) amidotransferase subunit GatC [Minisyncoccia bacterium]
MATIEEVKKLATLARISIDDAEIEKFTSEFDAILGYVGQLSGLDLQNVVETKPVLRNVMREDGEPHVSGRDTEKLVAQFPSREGDSLVVGQIIAQ